MLSVSACCPRLPLARSLPLSSRPLCPLSLRIPFAPSPRISTAPSLLSFFSPVSLPVSIPFPLPLDSHHLPLSVLLPTHRSLFLIVLPTTPPPANWTKFDAASDPPSSRWEGGVGGGLASDLASIGGGRGGELFAAKPATSAIETHPLPRPQGDSQTRLPADDLRDETMNHPVDDPANQFPNHFRRERLKTSLTHLVRFMR